MDKSIFEIAAEETIVFSSFETDTIISFSSSGLKWWFLSEDNKFMLADALEAPNDLSRAPITYCRKLASDWFDWEISNFDSRLNDENTETPQSTNDNSSCNSSVSSFAFSEKKFPSVEPPELDAEKRDVHTEHCCAKHHKCKYGNSKCTVISGKKKPSYSCNCEFM